MTPGADTDLYLKALEAENGEPVSAGARVAHVRSAVEAGRGIYIDLSAIPSELRAGVIDEIHKFVTLTAKRAISFAAGPARAGGRD